MKFYDPFAPGHDLHKPPAPPPVPGIPQWTLTIADLFSLILTFFVLLYSMTGIQQEKWEVIAESLRTQTAKVEDPTSPYDMPPRLLSIEELNLEQARNLDYLSVVVSKRLATLKGAEGILVKRDSDRVVLSLTESMLFESGMEPRKEALAALGQISSFLGNIDNAVTIEAYAQPRAKGYGVHASAWEYSLAQAQAVAGLLRQAGYGHPIDVYGTGSVQAPPDAGKTPQNRGNRIDIVIRENVAKF